MDQAKITELINRRRRQILVHSVLYYQMNESLVTDDIWAKWATELEDLQEKYPGIAKKCCYAKAFENFEHSTGYSLPLDDSWAVNKARQLLQWRDEM